MLRIVSVALLTSLLFAADDDWPRYRGPNNDGVARGDAPLEFSATKNVGWKVSIPGRGHSSPIVWGNKLFITTAVPSASSSNPRGGGEGSEHSFRLLCVDR